jgi:hypothetical protein
VRARREVRGRGGVGGGSARAAGATAATRWASPACGRHALGAACRGRERDARAGGGEGGRAAWAGPWSRVGEHVGRGERGCARGPASAVGPEVGRRPVRLKNSFCFYK